MHSTPEYDDCTADEPTCPASGCLTSPECILESSCQWAECSRQDSLTAVSIIGEAVTLCRYHRKHALGVSS